MHRRRPGDYSHRSVIDRCRRTDLTIVRVLVQLQTMTGYDLVQVGSVQDEE